MHDDRVLDGRIRRELDERVLALVHTESRPLTITAGPSLGALTPFEAGQWWGPPWGTTWFRFEGEIPEHWAGRRVEAVIDLGFHPDAAGFQCEGLVVDSAGRPVQGIHPRRTNLPIAAVAGPVRIDLEAASNPTFVQFRPPTLGGADAAGRDSPLLYRFRRAELVLVDTEAEALAHDLDVLAGLRRVLPADDPRRARLGADLAGAIDLLPDVAAARHRLRPAWQPARPTSHRIVATGHAHIDTAWLWPIGETVRKCTRTFTSAVDLLDRMPDHRFSCSQAQQYAWIEERHPELFERIGHHVAGGRWIPVGGMWVEADMNLPAGESLVRQIVHGQRYFESRFGMRCTEVWIPDVFGYPAGLPQVFAAGGMRRFVTQKLSWNKQNRFPHHTFAWEGLDGTRVLTHFPPVDTYNAEVTPADCAHASHNFADHVWSSWSLMPYGYGDGGGGPTREMVERARRLGDLDGAPRVEIGSPAEFFGHVEREIAGGAPVPVWRGELYFETHRGTLTSQRRTKIGNQRCEKLLRHLELWSATAGEHADVDDLWREVLTLQFHDILPGSSIAWVHAEAEATFDRVAAELEQRIDAVVARLAPPAALANPGGGPRDEVVIVDGPVDEPVDGPHQVLTGDDEPPRYAYRAMVPGSAIVPALALEADDAVVVTERSMTNGHVAVRFDIDGHVVSMIDLSHRRELIPTGRRAAVLELAVDHPVEYDAWDVESWTVTAGVPIEDDTEIEVLDAGPLVGRMRVRRRAGESSFVVTYSLRAGSPRLDIDLDIDWQHSEHLVSIRFPLAVHADRAGCDVQFGIVERPTHDSTSWDAAKFEVCAHRFVDIAEPSFGVAVLNDGPYGHGIHAHPDHTAPGTNDIRVSLLRSARYPDPDADHGRHHIRLAVLPHGPGRAEVVAEAEAFIHPIRAVTGTATAAPDPLVTLHGDGVLIDAVKMADDRGDDPAGDLIVRLHEHLGDRRPITLVADGPITAASRCTLLEEPTSGLEVSDGIVTLTLRPFELVTLRLSRG